MDLKDIMVCPHCDTVIDEGDRVYLRDDEIIGCQHCIIEDVIYVISKEELEEQYRESLYEDDKVSRMFDL